MEIYINVYFALKKKKKPNRIRIKIYIHHALGHISDVLTCGLACIDAEQTFDITEQIRNGNERVIAEQEVV